MNGGDIVRSPSPGAKIASALVEIKIGLSQKYQWEYLAFQAALCTLFNALAKGHFLPLWIDAVLRLPAM